MRALTQFRDKLADLGPAIQDRLLLTLLLLAALGLLGWAVAAGANKWVGELKTRYRLVRTVSFLTAFCGLLLVGLVWFEGMASFTTFLGFFSAGVAFALKDLIMNAAGSIYIVLRRPFEVGDRIAIGLHAGDVIDLHIFQFTILEIGNWVGEDQSTGRIIHIPNGKVFTEPLANYSKGFRYIWNEIVVPVTFASDWRKAKKLLRRIAGRHAEHLSEKAEREVREASRQYMIFYANLTPTVYTNVKENGVQLTVRYLCRPHRRRDTIQAIWEDILTEFALHPDVQLAYAPQLPAPEQTPPGPGGAEEDGGGHVKAEEKVSKGN